jgi:predicted O-methyltransferase YrrM
MTDAAAPVNRYPSSPAWRAVDDYFSADRAGVADRVDVVVGPAAESAQRLVDGGIEPFDLVFIDADKPSNPVYLDAALRLTGPGAVIVVDNVVRDGAVVDADSDDPRVQGVRRLVDAVAANPSLEATALQTVGVKGWDGLIVVRRKDAPAAG